MPHREPPETGFFRSIAEYTYDWETWVGEDGEPRWVNPAVERITGYSVEECLARPDYPLHLACPEDRARLARVLDDAAKGGSGNDVEFRVLHRDGEPRWVAISWQAVFDRSGQRRGYRTSVRDIDQRKRMESELHVMRRRAESAAIARARLLANVSHELRSPIHTISGFAELLALTDLDPEQRRHVERIRGEARVLAAQVEDLLQLSALEAGGVRLQSTPFDLRELLDAQLDAARPQAEHRGLALEGSLAGAPRWVEGDPARLAQVLRNLLENSIKFTDEGFVRLSALPVPLEPGILELVVEDSGVGMPRHRVAELLRPFEQADVGAAANRRGVGLGLAIVDRLVKAMGGTLGIESTEGQGTRVAVRLPLPEARSTEATRAVAAAPRIPARGHALVVDDSDTARELHVALLASIGWSADEASDGEQALELVGTRDFDVILLDYQMPGGDGAEVAIALRRVLDARNPGRHVPILMLTANVFAREQLDAARSSVDDVLSKPLSRAAFLQRFERALGGAPASAATTDAPSTVDEGAVDRTTLRELTGVVGVDGETLLARLLPRARAAMDEALGALLRAVDAGEREATARAAHRVAGEAGIVGATRLRRRAQALERDVSEGGSEVRDARGVHAELAHEWARVLEVLEAWNARGPADG